MLAKINQMKKKLKILMIILLIMINLINLLIISYYINAYNHNLMQTTKMQLTFLNNMKHFVY